MTHADKRLGIQPRRYKPEAWEQLRRHANSSSAASPNLRPTPHLATHLPRLHRRRLYSRVIPLAHANLPRNARQASVVCIPLQQAGAVHVALCVDHLQRSQAQICRQAEEGGQGRQRKRQAVW